MPALAKSLKSLWMVSGVMAALMCLPTLGNAFSPQETQPQALYTQQTRQELTLPQAILLALENNAALKAGQHEVHAIEAAGQQLSVVPNPELSVEFEEFAGSGAYSGSDAMQTTLTLSQRLELGNKRGHRRQVANRHNNAAATQQELRTAQVIRQTRQLYREALVARKQLRQAEKNVTQCLTLINSIEESIRAGKKAALEAQRIMPLQAQAQLRLKAAQTTLKARRQQLCSLWQGREEEMGPLNGSLTDVQRLPDLAEFRARIDQTATLRLARQNQHLEQDRFELERANRFQDVTLSLGVKHDSGTEDQALVAGFSVPLPLFDRNRGAIAAAQHRSSQARQTLLETRQVIWQQLVENHRLTTIAHQEITTFEQQLLPAAQSVFDTVTFGYQQGKYSVLDVLDAQGRLIESEDRYLNALADYHRSLTDLEVLFDFDSPATTAALADSDKE
jgi:cobalt-zinc-cadmium efflux system outer membrane protein